MIPLVSRDQSFQSGGDIRDEDAAATRSVAMISAKKQAASARPSPAMLAPGVNARSTRQRKEIADAQKMGHTLSYTKTLGVALSKSECEIVGWTHIFTSPRSSGTPIKH